MGSFLIIDTVFSYFPGSLVSLFPSSAPYMNSSTSEITHIHLSQGLLLGNLKEGDIFLASPSIWRVTGRVSVDGDMGFWVGCLMGMVL